MLNDAFNAAKAHARREYPREACGLIVQGAYVACENVAEDPLQDFEISREVFDHYLINGGIDYVVHSHPDGPLCPTLADMEGQVLTGLPWAIIPLDEDRMGEPIVWGDGVTIPPLVGREFVHGVTDCYSLIRDAFRLGKDELAKQDIIGWPYDPVELPVAPREDSWWDGDYDLYHDNYAKEGFTPIKQEEARPGDVFLLRIRSEKLNHGGLLVGNNLILHHLPMRLSRREPAGVWGRHADLWLRYEGKPA